MQKAGIVGGMGPESTVAYYKGINKRFQQVTGRMDAFPNLVLESVDIFQMLGYCKTGDYDNLIEFLLDAINRVYAAGADFGVLAANTPHIVFDELARRSPIPLLSIVEATYEETKRAGIKQVALLGTRFTMQNTFFKKPFLAGGIQVVVPDNQTIETLDGLIQNELEYGIIKEETRNTFVGVMDHMIADDKVEGIILGCTELPLLLSGNEVSVPMLDTMQIHINKIVTTITC